METESQKPQNSQHHENRPKHIYSPLRVVSITQSSDPVEGPPRIPGMPLGRVWLILIRNAEQDCSFAAILHSPAGEPSSERLGGFERLAAFQATGFVARGDEFTKWANPLGREIAISRGYSQRLSQRRRQKGAQTANPGE